ncbi:hypothetical protein Gotri_024012 [Gossypium trilobum]|uniref:Uncharacterized protein n=1 Tax=Gossypium trilobum TaxID=34281 RepID=A0A7J9DLQ3_9ROSI|nr:hypothetical protein [Gossypium trilobum]
MLVRRSIGLSLTSVWQKGMSSKYKAFHIKFQSSRLDDKAFSSNDDE